MSVKVKVFLIIVLSVLFLAVATSMVFNFAYFGYVNKEQERKIKNSFEVVDYIINKEEEDLKSTALDWSQWDDTYKFVNDSNKEYISSNLQGSTLITLNLKLMTFINNEGNVVYSKKYGIDEETADNLAQKLILRSKSLDSLNNVITGLLYIDGKAFIAAVSRITPSKNKFETDGSLIMVREIDDKMLSYIQNVAKVSLKFAYPEQAVSVSDEVLNGNIKIKNYKTFSESSRTVMDINGEDSIIFTLVMQKNNYGDIVFFFKSFIIYFLFFMLLVSTINAIIINKFILKRLSKLNQFVEEVAVTRDTSLSIDIPGKDEFSRLADATNRMLSRLDAANKSIKEMGERFGLMMEATRDGFLDIYPKEKKMYISKEWKSIIGFEDLDEHELFSGYFSRIHPECLERFDDKFESIICGKIEYFQDEYRLINKSGEIIWVMQRGKVTEKDENNNAVRIVSTLTNITDRKQYEDEILFLSYSDKLTGLRNRAYVEKQFEILDRNKKSMYFIIMGDLNGLKLTNDALGYKEGDRLLCAVAKMLKEVCETDDIISRWGGDEFIILINNKDRNYVFNLLDKIKEACEKAYKFHFKISISLGYAEKDKETQKAEVVMSLAERRMYRNKLMESKSARSAIINSLLKTLHEKNSETEEHTIRIKNLSYKLGKRLGLAQDKLDELELLSLLHDIGKIGIPEQILMKPSSLTNEEWNIMKTHTDIGYRIAKSTPELAHIADEILAHHERYDGTGYPNALKGEKIPLLSRIINVVDSFDVMTHKRIYKEALDTAYAIEELKRCAGTQFDPFITNEFIALLHEEEMQAACQV